MPKRVSRVLVVDDDVDTCENLSDILADCGYSVLTAHNAQDALQLVGVHRFDVAIVDLRMPGMDGVTLSKEIKRVSSSTVAMIVTAFAGNETLLAAESAGVWRVLSKPIDVTKLLGLIQSAANQPLLLVVDDDRDFCDSLWDLLHSRNYRVTLAHSLSDVETLRKNQSFDVVLVDMRMSGDDDGVKVLHAIQQVNPETQAILVTAFREELQETVSGLGELGFHAICDKPLDVERLLQTLRQLTANPTVA